VGRSARRGQVALYILLGLGLLAAGYIFRADLLRLLAGLEGTIGLLGPAAPLGMAVICGLWGVLCLPGPLMQGTVATLFAAQPPIALAVVAAGETLAMSISFLSGRSLGRERVRHRLEGKSWFTPLEEETRRKGFAGVFLFRLMPFFPNALASYGFGLTSLRFPTYVAASVLGSLPKLVLYIYGTTSVINLFRRGMPTPTTLGALAVAIVGLGLGARWLQGALRRRQETE
jgi:uncharacterized membrane protein YdjX (TVP38/TMEM64 family)